MKLQLRPGQEIEVCTMLIECCAQERTYLRFYGSLGERFCCIGATYQALFDEAFAKQYSMIHRLETNKLRNIAKFFAHLIHSEALPWGVMEYIVITEEETSFNRTLDKGLKVFEGYVEKMAQGEVSKQASHYCCNF